MILLDPAEVLANVIDNLITDVRVDGSVQISRERLIGLIRTVYPRGETMNEPLLADLLRDMATNMNLARANEVRAEDRRKAAACADAFKPPADAAHDELSREGRAC